MRNMSSRIQAAVAAFLERSSLLSGAAISYIENPIEEIDDARARKKPIRLFQQAPGVAIAAAKGPPIRLEENYLYSTRYFGAGAIAASAYNFFAYNVGAVLTNAGYPALAGSATPLETNLDTAGYVPSGKNFVFRQLGVAFNAEIQPSDLCQLLDAGHLFYQKNGDQFSLRHGPAQFWPGGQGVSGISNGSGVSTVHNGLSDPRAMRTLRVPRVIRSSEVFSYQYVVPRTTRADGASAWSLAGTISTLPNDTTAVGCLMRVLLWGGQTDQLIG
jgi:hypothetical protein